jgi:hypothetical protein
MQKNKILTGMFLEEYVGIEEAQHKMVKDLGLAPGQKANAVFRMIKQCCLDNEKSHSNMGTLYNRYGYMFTFDDFNLDKTNEKRVEIDLLVQSKKLV